MESAWQVACILILFCCISPGASFNLSDLQNLVSGPLSTQTSLNICSVDGPPPAVSLSGPIPPELGNLTNLTVLGLCRFNLSGGIPLELGNLVNLEDLNLGFNGLTGGVPKELGSLTRLRKLYLKGNSLSGPIPPELGSLASLTLLNLGANRLNGSIPVELGGLTSLTNLELLFNNLTGPVPKELANLAQLTVMGLQNNQLNGSIPPQLAGLTQLTDLALQYNQLSGPIPRELGSMVSLTSMYLWNNSLSGPVPSQLGNLKPLVNLFLHNNSLVGPIPPNFGQLTNLKYLVLERNNISGPIPPELGALSNLLTLDLGVNHLSGPIPVQLANLTSLTQLYLFNNNLSGPIPPELGNLVQLTALLLGQNRLTGPIPPGLANPPGLNTVTLNDNNLTGTVSPGFLARFGRNNILPGNNALSVASTSTPPPGTSPAPAPPQGPPTSSSSSPVGIIAGAVAGAVCAALVGLAIGCFLYRRHKRSPAPPAKAPPPKELDMLVPSSAGSGASRRRGSACLDRSFTLAELREATGGWAPGSVVGSGAFGTVYRAVLSDGTVVAVKRLDQVRRARGAFEEQAWHAELATLSEVRHKNLVRLLGTCVEEGERLLVLEFFPGGSLGARLHAAARGKREFLSWGERMAVLEGVCRGLTYMHHDITPPLLHRDIKAANILLREKGGGACIADFGLARLMEDGTLGGGETSSAVKGTLPYMAPEYLQGGFRCLSAKCDVYSFGVVVLELLTGRPVSESFARGGKNVPLVEYAASLVREGKRLEIVDPALWDAFDVSQADCCIGIALECLQADPIARPTMEQVTHRLRTLAAPRLESPGGGESAHDVLSGLAGRPVEYPGGPGWDSGPVWESGTSSGMSSGAQFKFVRAR